MAAALLSAGGCGGDVDQGNSDETGTGGSVGGTTGTGGTTSGKGGASGHPGVGGNGFGGAGGGTGGIGGGTGGVGAIGGATGFGGAAGAPNCSTPNWCYTCEQLKNEFSWYLDAFSCDSADGSVDGGAVACPDLTGAGTRGCSYVCTAPVQQGATCCYGTTPAAPACGRPFSVGDEVRVAVVVRRKDWAPPSADVTAELEAELRSAIAREWQNDAVLEHASIASFARLTLELLALGAPSELVAASQGASLDEIEHARLCFALAGRYAGAPLGPGVLPMNGALAECPDLAVLSAMAVREGCVGETLAALLATEQLSVATDPQVCAALERIAADEASHAEFSWKLVRWAIATGGERVRTMTAAAFDSALAELELVPGDSELASYDEEPWHAHGRLLASERARVLRSAVADVVRPCARALLESESAQAAVALG